MLYYVSALSQYSMTALEQWKEPFMKKQNKRKNVRFKATWHYSSSKQPQIEDMAPEDLVVLIRRAEKEALPVIRHAKLGPAAALFLLAQYTSAFVTGSNAISEDSATRSTNRVLSLWQDGTYAPSRAYPFTLEETLREIGQEMKPARDFSDSFRPYVPQNDERVRGLGQVSGGIVKHPETHLWQIWMTLGGPCSYLGAYRDLAEAHRSLEEIVQGCRRGGTKAESEALYLRVQSRGTGQPKQLPLDMHAYLMSNIHKYTINL